MPDDGENKEERVEQSAEEDEEDEACCWVCGRHLALASVLAEGWSRW